MHFISNLLNEIYYLMTEQETIKIILLMNIIIINVKKFI